MERRLTELTAGQIQLREQVAELTDNQQRTAATAGESAGALSEALPRVNDHGTAIDTLRGRVDAISEQLAATPRVSAVCWPALTADEADETWKALATWITEVLGPFYRITRSELPDCWARHPDAVLELVWLHTCYREIYSTDAGRPNAAAEWHTRHRPNALAAVADAIPERLCRPGEHLILQREADAARSDARDARTLASPRAGVGYTGPDGYQPPTPVHAPPGAAPGRTDAATPPRYDPTRDQVTEPQHWRQHYDQARNEDLAWRRARDAQLGH